MIERYPDTAGCRLDDGQNVPSGPAIDLCGRLPYGRPGHATATLWVRESGTSGEDGQVQASCPVSANDLMALREGINRMLRAAGYRGT